MKINKYISFSAGLFFASLVFFNSPLTAKDNDGMKIINFNESENMDSLKNKPDKNVKIKYSIEETTALLDSGDIGDLKLDHDDHVYKCMKISKMGKDLKGALEALVEFNTDFGDTLDEDEVNLFIDLSRMDTNLYKKIAMSAADIGKKKATLIENQLLVNSVKQGNGRAVLSGLQLAEKCNYDVGNGFLSRERVDLIIKLGEIKDQARFLKIYEAMIDAGMDGNATDKSLKFLYMINKLNGDVSHMITDFLEENKWKSREQPGDREYEVIRDLMKGDFSTFYGMRNSASTSFETLSIDEPSASSTRESEPVPLEVPEEKTETPVRERETKIEEAAVADENIRVNSGLEDTGMAKPYGNDKKGGTGGFFSGFVHAHFLELFLLSLFICGIGFLLVFHKNAVLRFVGISRHAVHKITHTHA